MRYCLAFCIIYPFFAGHAFVQDAPQGPFSVSLEIQNAPNPFRVASRPGTLQAKVLDRLGRVAPLNGVVLGVECSDSLSPLHKASMIVSNGQAILPESVQWFTSGKHFIKVRTADGTIQGEKRDVVVEALPKGTALEMQQPIPQYFQAGGGYKCSGKSQVDGKVVPNVEIRLKVSQGTRIHPQRVYADQQGEFSFIVIPPPFHCGDSGVVTAGAKLEGSSLLTIECFIDLNNNGTLNQNSNEPGHVDGPVLITTPCPIDLLVTALFELTILAGGGVIDPPVPGPIDAVVVSALATRPSRPKDELARLEKARQGVESILQSIQSGEWKGRFSRIVKQIGDAVSLIRNIARASSVVANLECAQDMLRTNPDVKEISTSLHKRKKKAEVLVGFTEDIQFTLLGTNGSLLDPGSFHECTKPRTSNVSVEGPGTFAQDKQGDLSGHFECTGHGEVKLGADIEFSPTDVIIIESGKSIDSASVPRVSVDVIAPAISFRLPVLFLILQQECSVELRLDRTLICANDEVKGTLTIEAKIPGQVTGTWKIDASDNLQISYSEDNKVFQPGNSAQVTFRNRKVIFLKFKPVQPSTGTGTSLVSTFALLGSNTHCGADIDSLKVVEGKFEPDRQAVARPTTGTRSHTAKLVVRPKLSAFELKFQSSDKGVAEVVSVTPVGNIEPANEFLIGISVKAGNRSEKVLIDFIVGDKTCATLELNAVSLTGPVPPGMVDVFIKCEELARRYKPKLWLHSTEFIGPSDAQFYLDNARLLEDTGTVTFRSLNPPLKLISATVLEGQDPLDATRRIQVDVTRPNRTFKIELLEDATREITLDELRRGEDGRFGKPKPKVYYRCSVTFGSPRPGAPAKPLLFLQYWLFSPSSTAPGENARTNSMAHEGDWEMFQVVFAIDGDLNVVEPPEGATFSQHHYAMGLDWDDIQLRPYREEREIFVSAGGHATYPFTGLTGKFNTRVCPDSWPGLLPKTPLVPMDYVERGKVWEYTENDLVALPDSIARFPLFWGPKFASTDWFIKQVPGPALRLDCENNNIFQSPEKFHLLWRTRTTPLR